MGRTNEINPVVTERLGELHADLETQFEKIPQLRERVANVTHASDFLTRLLITDSDALALLIDPDRRPVLPETTSVDDLVRWKRHEMLRIATRDLSGLDSIEMVGDALAQLAEDVIGTALELVDGTDQLAVAGMGKLGGRELNYASDVDLLFIGDAPSASVREVLDICRKCFRIDVNLRPEGRDGPLVRTVESYVRYWSEWAQPWEFQALLKARPIAGNRELSMHWATASTTALWDYSFGPDELRSLRDLKARSESIVDARGLTTREVKRGRGGIRDIEFAVQLLQLVHGSADESIRSPNTLTALSQLVDGGYITADDSESLATSYRFLRNVEHRLQLVDEEQTHTLPTDLAGRERLARSMGCVDTPHQGAVERFDNALRTHQTQVRTAHERLYFRPLLESFASSAIESDDVMETRLAAFGFTDASRTREAVRELTRGLARSSRLMRQLMPLLLDWLSDSPNPDEGLLGLRTLIAGFRTPQEVVSLFRDSPEAARRLCLLLGTSRMIAQTFSRQPELLQLLGNDEAIVPVNHVLQRLQQALEWHKQPDDRLATALRFTRSEQTRIACADVLHLIEPAETGIWRCALAEAVLQQALDDAAAQIPVAVIGMGRFGGEEMSYASDLDVIVVHNGTGPDDQREGERVAQFLLDAVGNPSPGKRLYPLDYDLRPEGKKGLIARSLESCAEYYDEWAETWERQALVRARHVAGDAATGAMFLDTVHDFVWQQPLGVDELRAIRHLKARMETERLPRGQDPLSNLKLGRGSLSDVEWTVQLLQLLHHVPATNTLRALERLRERDIVSEDDARVLEESWTFCDRVRNRMFLVNGGPTDALPTTASGFAVLARSLDMHPSSLRERHLQVTRRAREVMERLFYSRSDDF
jgi:[glutamine synthetase] adenylyltransferase / [glutamine synthetase]-adenylyl-L-tyrosine phosphorylase